MKRGGFILRMNTILIIIAIMVLAFVNAQEATPTPTQIPIAIIPFPSLDCNDIQAPFIGSTWGEITVGSSNINDLREYINTLSSSYTENSFTSLQITSFSVSDRVSETENIPSVISACIQPDNQEIIALTVLTPSWLNQIYMIDLVAEYGIPDFVLWDEILSSRVLVWLTEGIAASVNVDESEQFNPYGLVTRVVYFPYQSLEGYEERWPYTHRAASRPELVTLTPQLPNADNPFDFDAMIATITAEPSRTPTPTFAPRPTEVTGTPTP